MVRELKNTVLRLLGRKRAEQELDSELSYHIERQTEENLRRGMTPGEARRRARADFGSVESAREGARDAWGVGLIDALRQDGLVSLRGLMKSPSFALGAILTLALGIGSASALFSVVHGVLLSPLPYKDGERVVIVRQRSPRTGSARIGFSPAELRDLRQQTQSFDEIVEWHTMEFTLLGRKEPEVVRVGVVSANFFDALGVKPMLGRAFLPGEDKHDAAPVFVLSHKYWERSHGGDRGVVGQAFRMNDRVHTVVGVLPPLPDYPAEVDVYMPISSCPFRVAAERGQNRQVRLATLFARTKPGVSLEQARSDLERVFQGFHTEFPQSYPQGDKFQPQAMPLFDEMTRNAKPTLMLLLAATGLVLLIACSNVASLFLARLLRRERELAIRAALGASRLRLVRQLITEAGVVSIAAAVIGLVLAGATLRVLIRFLTPLTPRALEISLNWPAVLFALGAGILTALICGTLPALQHRTDLAASTKEGSAASTTSTHHMRLRSFLVAGQVALSFLLLMGAALLARTVFNLMNVDPGFRGDRVLTMRVSPAFNKYRDGNAARDAMYRVLESLRAIPEVETAGLSFVYPLEQSLPFNQQLVIEGQANQDVGSRPLADFAAITPGYFETLGVPLQQGRMFRESDREDAPLVAMVNESMARRHWKDTSPIGRRISVDGGERWATIVGVVGNVRKYGLDREPGEEFYMPIRQSGAARTFVMRTRVDPERVYSQVRQAVYSVDPEMAIRDMRTMDQAMADAIASPQLRATLLLTFAGVTLLITLAGLSSLLSLSVNQRSTELGIRMALGASRGSVVGMVLQGGLRLVWIGVAVGAAAAALSTGLLKSFLYGVQATDAVTFAAAGTILAVVSAAACALPAVRAAQIDPIKALRSE